MPEGNKLVVAGCCISKQNKKRNQKQKIKSKSKFLIGRRAIRKQINWTGICSDKQEALECNLKAYNKQWKWVKKSRSGRLAHMRACRTADLYIHALACGLFCSGLFIIYFTLCHLAPYCCEVLLNSKKHAQQDNLCCEVLLNSKKHAQQDNLCCEALLNSIKHAQRDNLQGCWS